MSQNETNVDEGGVDRCWRNAHDVEEDYSRAFTRDRASFLSCEPIAKLSVGVLCVISKLHRYKRKTVPAISVTVSFLSTPRS